MKPISNKRLAAIKSGSVKMRGTFAVDAKALQTRIGAMCNAKPKDSAQEARKKAKAKADKWFSEFIRLRDSDQFGIATCVTSGKRGFWRTMDCGHYVSRAKESTRYDEQNCHAQGKQSNRFQGGHFLEHGRALDRLHGVGTRDALERKAGMVCKRTTADYLFLAGAYRERAERIKAVEPERYFGANR